VADSSVIYPNPAEGPVIPIPGPGIHALVVGVSDYTYLPDPEKDDPPEDESWNFVKLSSPALSAFRIYQWLIKNKDNLSLPLKSIRLLVAPSAAEKAADADLKNLQAVVPTWEAFHDAAWAWREDAGKNPQDMTFFYFAGHGLQRGPEEGLLALADFAKPQTPKLSRCISFGDIRTGMAPTNSYPNIAQTQFYFVDACRVRPSAALNKLVNPQPQGIWEIELPNADRRPAPVLFSTVDNAIAVGRKGKLSYFAEGLLQAFESGADDPDPSSNPQTWPVTSVTMKTALDRFYTKHGLGTVYPGGWVGAPVLRYLKAAPDVNVDIHIVPDLLAGDCDVELCDDDGNTVKKFSACPAMKFELTVKAGIYRLIVKSPRIKGTLYSSKSTPLNQRTPISFWLNDLTTSIL
jgi:hypothetical protein